MKRSELKDIIKPLVKECVTEAFIEEGLLSGVISEVVKGLSTNIVVEQKTQVEEPAMFDKSSFQKRTAVREQISESRKKLLDAIGNDSYNGVDLFEGTTPAPSQRSVESQASSPLGGQDPSDAGVDISGIVALGGKNWKALVG